MKFDPRVEQWRLRHGSHASPPGADYGFFRIPGPMQRTLNVMVSAGCEETGIFWEHVSVSTPTRCPNWPEMDFVKRLFWSDEETVMQLHVPRAQHISFHPYCLHLWRPLRAEIPLPPPETVGPVPERDILGVLG